MVTAFQERLIPHTAFMRRRGQGHLLRR